MPPRPRHLLSSTIAGLSLCLVSCASYQRTPVLTFQDSATAFHQAFLVDAKSNQFVLPAPNNTGSMKPLITTPCHLLVERRPYSSLKAGDFVATRRPDVITGAANSYVAHVLRWKTPDGWHTYGINNRYMDPVLTTPDNYAGVIIRIYSYPPSLPATNHRATTIH